MFKLMNVSHTNVWLAFVILYCHLENVNGREDIVYATSFLDNRQMRNVYRTFRDLAQRIVGQTGERTKGPFLQAAGDKFPCNVTGMRSKTVPNNVHRLRPGKFNAKQITFLVFTSN